ncbi:MAG: hypothetical protein ACE5KE_08745 [Methanosarcinales archaeon]
MREIRETIKELIESQKRTNEHLKRIDEKIKNLTESQKKNDEHLKRIDEKIKELTESHKITTEEFNYNDFFSEEMVLRIIPELFGELGIKIYGSSEGYDVYKNGKIIPSRGPLAVGKREDGKKVVLALDRLSSLELEYVDEFLEELDHFFEFFKEYRDKELIGIVCGVNLVKGVKRNAERNGLYVLGPSGETMVILNKPDFKPKVWRVSLI